MNMNADDPAFYRIPETDEEASQFLFLYELSLGYGMDLTDQINVDRSSTGCQLCWLRYYAPVVGMDKKFNIGLMKMRRN